MTYQCILWLSNIALLVEDYLMFKQDILDQTFDLEMQVSYCDLYFIA